ncbi:Uncharacterised protein [Vibrio cholerae]|nr:Uncharacterised protein [Vibrio cholerae]CSB27060.1 Uncharacterised protein [Vibrio cholerae]CSC11705.1 Uncharacterised protein [Vibrio cholerae]CSC44484.1 Uncharacterised protein [Vibrio cholerae]CSC82232.1 Uncharacterised protein [Vibrio cholerae]
MCNQLCRHQPTALLSKLNAILSTRVILRRGNARKAFTETLHAATFLIDTNQNRSFRRLTDRFIECQQLLVIVIVATKQNHTTHCRVLQNFAIFGTQFVTGHIQPKRSHACSLKKLAKLSQATRLFSLFFNYNAFV